MGRKATTHISFCGGMLVPNEQGLLPCPFCGDPQPSLMRDLFVLCECGGKGPLADSQADAIAAWNQRGGVAHEP